MTSPQRWDIFCRVVDNFGDAGVCWRLARRLDQEGCMVRLWIDGLETLRRMHPAITAAAEQVVDRIQILEWSGSMRALPAEVVIEAFGCGLPAPYAAAMEKAQPKSLWIVLEYLSAEPWVAEHHGLPSPHPRRDLRRYFFFPGFTAQTGGLLREPDLFARRDSFDADDRAAFWKRNGHVPPPRDAITVSFFAYEAAPVDSLLDAWKSSPAPVVAAVPEGRVLPVVLQHFELDSPPPDGVIRCGALELRVVPFVPQVQYDELLWSCDINFVRGEDSVVRALWAGRPFVWQIYPQETQAHWAKLDAFLERYAASAPKRTGEVAAAMMRAWNGIGPAKPDIELAWRDFMAERASLTEHTRHWACGIARNADLAANLVSFCREKLK
jgi:uncharacterized repeat protein (TIGR03837 family)